MRRLLLPLLIAVWCTARPAAADDVADEAELNFQLGARHYQRGEYESALAHFLTSNRLVPNRNVLFNVARTFEKLDRFPEAYRYYVQSLEGETDPAARERIEAALGAIAARVAVLDVTTEPPGATLYLDRRDLGPRGESPRRLGIEAGRYKILAELPGYLPAEADLGEIRAGETRTVRLALSPILGEVAIEAPAGGTVHLDAPDSPSSCSTPCRLSLPPGSRTLYVQVAGYRAAESRVDVVAHRTVTLRPRFEPLTGTVTVSTDEPRALIQVDGKPRGFTPAVLTLPVGTHDVVLTLDGFRPVERSITVAADDQVRLDATLTRSDEVIAASRAREAAEAAPSSVTIIPRREITSLAYPTIAEALRGTRGVYVWDDRAYVAVGMRGLGRLGSYGNRVLVLVDGHPMNDNWLGSSYVGFDARTDLADVERIEVVRGPGSVLYGTNAVSGVINLVTRHEDVPPGAEVGVSTHLDGVARARARGDVKFGERAGAWTSVGVARSSGRDFFFPEYAGSDPAGGFSRNSDRMEAGTLQGRVYYDFVTAQYYLHRHSKQIPTGEFGTLLGDPRTSQTDTRAFVEVRADPRISDAVESMTRVHWNRYDFEGFYARAPADGGVEKDTFEGSWIGLEQRFALRLHPAFRVTAGAEGQLHYQAEQRAEDDTGVFLDDTGDAQRDYQVGAAYGVAEVGSSDAARLSAGARVDVYSTFGASVSPRAAFVFQPYDQGSSKIIAGRAFRAPSIYELYYNDDGFTQVASPDLDPELVYSAELEHTHRFSPTVSGTASAYANYATNLIVTTGAGDTSDPLQYQNSGFPLLVVGGELEVRRDYRKGFMVSATYGLQHARFIESESLSDLVAFRKAPGLREVSNVPTHLASLKAAAPLVGRALTAGTRFTLEGPRYDRFEAEGDPEQRRTDAAVIWDLVVSGTEQRLGLNYSVGVYNAFDWRYALPVSAEFRQRTIQQNGRTFLASVDARF